MHVNFYFFFKVQSYDLSESMGLVNIPDQSNLKAELYKLTGEAAETEKYVHLLSNFNYSKQTILSEIQSLYYTNYEFPCNC